MCKAETFLSFAKFVDLLESPYISSFNRNIGTIAKVIKYSLEAPTITDEIKTDIENFVTFIGPYLNPIKSLAFVVGEYAQIKPLYEDGKAALQALVSDYEPEVFRIKTSLRNVEVKLEDIKNQLENMGKAINELVDICFDPENKGKAEAKIMRMKFALTNAERDNDFCRKQLGIVLEKIGEIKNNVRGASEFCTTLATIFGILGSAVGFFLGGIAGLAIGFVAGASLATGAQEEATKKMKELELLAEKADSLLDYVKLNKDTIKDQRDQLDELLIKVGQHPAELGLTNLLQSCQLSIV